MKTTTTVLVAALVALSAAVAPAAAALGTNGGPTGVAAGSDAVQSAGGSAVDDADNHTAPPDPEEDVLGWEEVDGYGLWYNESIVVDRSNGLNGTELDKVVARGMARVEEIRRLEFEKSVPVDVISRSEYREQNAQRFTNVSEADRIHQNVKWEAMFMVNETTDALAVQQSNLGSTVLGYYSPSQEAIVIVSNNESSPKMNEITLSQELFHALQDQKFNLSSYNQTTEELNNAVSGIIEGDGNYVDSLYQDRCTAESGDPEWNCLMPQEGGGGGNGSIHFGLYLVSFQPYSDGPKFVKQIYDRSGWSGVNAVYENPPASTEQVMHFPKYESDAPAEMSFTDRSDDEWNVLRLENSSINYATFGEAGLATMLFYPFYDSGRTKQPVLSARQFFNVTRSGQISSFDPVSYGNEYTAGWDGDRLYPYVNDASAETNETGYVWKTVWDDEANASEFLEGYEKLLDYYGAEPVDGRANTYRIPDGDEYSDAFYVTQQGDTVFVVNAPTVEDLSGVREGAAPKVEDPDPTTTPGTTDPPDDTTTPPDDTSDRMSGTTEGTIPPTDGNATDGNATGDGDGGGGQGLPGFGFGVAVVALLAAVLFARRRR